MRELRRAVRARLAQGERRESGWTLVELIVSMGIFGGLLAIVFSVLVTVSMQTKDNLARTRAVDETQIGLMQIDRQVRSGNVIADPANEGPALSGVEPYYALRVYTQTDGVFQCVQWRVRYPAGSSFGELEYRSWKPTWQSTGGVQQWRTVARNIVKPATSTVVAADPATWPPFFVQATDAESSSSAQTIRVTLRVKDPAQRASSKPATVTSTLTGRNTIFGYPADTCSPVPPP
ncbi:type II secretion system protein J [Cellulomonas sp. Root137]|uniref:PulJ/GspJ family protein n=1 Tax=Cellulomonas sp. Root137 TaxID=1736459 RepID=UPI0006F54B6C|nr:type II secretion system protein [Cellulomonas sp. Root137]KQY44073.1 hypothetical protein ASD18_17210 [Cellulomonas sp. Root137]